MLSFPTLRKANVMRIPLFKNAKGRFAHPEIPGKPPGHDWSLSQWSNATLGELGEAANIIKKIERGDFTVDVARSELAKELADACVYLDILAHRADIDLGEAVRQKFNIVSKRVGADVFIRQTDTITETEVTI